MGKPIATVAGGVCFAFPDVCWTPVPTLPDLPIPYPNIGQLSEADPVSQDVLVEGEKILLEDSEIENTSGDEAGVNNGIASGEIQGKVAFTSWSTTVKVEGKGVVRMFDTTTQNNQNCVGVCLGGVPTVLVGG